MAVHSAGTNYTSTVRLESCRLQLYEKHQRLTHGIQIHGRMKKCSPAAVKALGSSSALIRPEWSESKVLYTAWTTQALKEVMNEWRAEQKAEMIRGIHSNEVFCLFYKSVHVINSCSLISSKTRTCLEQELSIYMQELTVKWEQTVAQTELELKHTPAISWCCSRDTWTRRSPVFRCCHSELQLRTLQLSLWETLGFWKTCLSWTCHFWGWKNRGCRKWPFCSQTLSKMPQPVLHHVSALSERSTGSGHRWIMRRADMDQSHCSDSSIVPHENHTFNPLYVTLLVTRTVTFNANVLTSPLQNKRERLCSIRISPEGSHP